MLNRALGAAHGARHRVKRNIGHEPGGMSRALVFSIGSALERWHIALVLCWWHDLHLGRLLVSMASKWPKQR